MNTENIRTRAYFLWVDAGKPEGQSDYFWSVAENMQRMQQAEARIVSSISNGFYYVPTTGVHKVVINNDEDIQNMIYVVTRECMQDNSGN